MSDPTFASEASGPDEAPTFTRDEVEEQKQRALADPGPSWKDWLYFSHLKWWMGLLFLVVDAWIVVTFLVVQSWLLLAASTAVAVYLEILIWGYLWHRPDPERPSYDRRFRGLPYQVGRWTPEGAQLRATGKLTVGEKSPDPREFL